MNDKGWIAVDLDGTLAHYDRWDNGKIGKPIPAMVRRVKRWISEGQTVKIFTARASFHGIPLPGGGVADVITPIQEWCKEHLGAVLEVTDAKDFGTIEIWDDRAITVKVNEGEPCAPCPEMKGKVAVVLYFADNESADEFVAMIKDAKPGMIARNL